PPGGFVNGPLLHGSRADAQLFPGQILTNFSQKLDHFDPLDTGRWNQRMYYNPSYVDKEKSSGQDLIFLMIGGEGEEPPKWSGDPNVQIMQFAALFGAEVYDLEHRFFGESRPINDMKTSSLRLLTTQQALADLAYFITVMNQEKGYKNPKWITFGGSYPAQLSAKMRSKYPELVAGAVGSSAPLHLTLDTYGYAEGVQQVLEATPITNSKGKTCPDLVREAFDKMQQLSLTKEGRKTLNKQMKLDPPFGDKTTKHDIINFFANVYGTFQDMIQYTYDGRSEISKTLTTAEQLCRIMNQEEKDPVDNVWDLNEWYFAAYGDNLTSFDNDYTEMIEELKVTNWDILGEDGSSSRGWTWICCNELGAFQTTDSDTVFGSVIPMGYFFEMCEDMFGPPMNGSYVRDQNTASNVYYGGDDYFDATNVILPNGMFDPWHTIGFYGTDESKNLITLKIEGAAHCSDMYPEYDGEPAALPAARQKIRDFLSGLIYDADHPKKSASSLTISALLFVIVARLL
ncbi:hypothetical protein PENTCL1PPCAC_26042, partial [Pristionchus entomophagus]